ncbi:MAG TPA: hypothetical protein DCY13_18855 [Verrucomicrobiales bacterium]|nr:hypothetical protein [Verrucomicrobiales bacterium]
MKKAATITALLSVIAVCAVVIHRYSGIGTDDGYVSARERAIIKKFDTDGDGRLNRTEKRRADAAIEESERREKEAWIEKLDKDGDGKVSESEKASAAKEAAERRQEWIRKHDKDGDGKISEAEKEAAGRAERTEAVKKFDRDGDGRLNEEEGRAARRALGR